MSLYVDGVEVLSSINMHGTWAAVGTVTMPAITLGGAVAGGDQAFTNVGDMIFAAGSILASGSTNTNTLLLRANDTTFITLTTGATDVCELDGCTLDTSIAKGTWTASGTWTIPAITLGGTVTINAQAFDAGSGYVTINTTGTVGLLVDKGIAVGTSSVNYAQCWFGLNFISGGAVTFASKMYNSGSLTGAAGDTLFLAGTYFRNTITTQNQTETIGVVAQGYFREPEITIGNDTVTIAASIYIHDAPTEGATNAAIYVASGDTNLVSLTMRGNILGGAYYHQFTEMAAPGAGAANTARIYAVVGGDTLTDLAAVFQDGTVDIFAQESTEPDSPIFQFPDNTELKTFMKKPDRKTIQFVSVFPDGREFIMRELRYPTERW